MSSILIEGILFAFLEMGIPFTFLEIATKTKQVGNQSLASHYLLIDPTPHELTAIGDLITGLCFLQFL